jgi:hypothetical protein
MPAYTTAQRIRIVILGAAVPLLIVGIGVAIVLSWSDLPDPIAIHWGVSNVPNGFGGVGEAIALVAVITVLFAAITTLTVVPMKAGGAPNYVPRLLVATSVWLSVFLTVGIGGTIAMQRGLVDATAAGSPAIPMLVGFAVAVPVAVLAWVLTPRAAVTHSEDFDSPALDLSTDERVLWVRSAGPAPAVGIVVLALALVIIAAATLAGFTDGIGLIVLIPGLIVLLSLTSLFWRVRIDATGFVARSILGVPRFRYTLAAVTEARTANVVPIGDFGGWGIRFGSSGRLGVVLRAGQALEIERTDGRVFVITVDDAATAAALLNGLVARMRNLSSDR